MSHTQSAMNRAYQQPHVARMLQERDDLCGKIRKLEDFLDRGGVAGYRQRHLLQLQLETMRAYEAVLHRRILEEMKDGNEAGNAEFSSRMGRHLDDAAQELAILSAHRDVVPVQPDDCEISSNLAPVIELLDARNAGDEVREAAVRKTLSDALDGNLITGGAVVGAPSVGRIVHFHATDCEEPKAAIITEVCEDGTVCLAVFKTGFMWGVRRVPYGLETGPRDHWTWPLRT